MALHRAAEFNKSHVPAFVAEEEPRAYVSVYPFVRSYQWYLLDPAERRRMLAEHGMMAREYPDVRANTVPCFALNDYEWILAFEADEMHRHLDPDAPPARLSRRGPCTRVEIPFYTVPAQARPTSSSPAWPDPRQRWAIGSGSRPEVEAPAATARGISIQVPRICSMVLERALSATGGTPANVEGCLTISG